MAATEAEGKPSKASKVFIRPSIPIPLKTSVNWGWMLMWLCAVVVFFGSFPIWGLILHAEIVLPLSDNVPLQLTASLQGCDVSFSIGQKDELRLSYWRGMGVGSGVINGSELVVTAHMQRSIRALKCSMRVTLREREGPHFESVIVNIEPDPYVVQLQAPANVLEVVSVAMERVKIRKFLYVNVSTISETVLIDVNTTELKAEILGGSLHIEEDQNTIGNAVYIMGHDALINVMLRGVNANVNVDQETFKMTSLAGMQIRKNGTDSHQLESRSDGSGEIVDLQIVGPGCAVYVLVDSDSEQAAESCPQLATVFGEAVLHGPAFTASGKAALRNLGKWLQSPSGKVAFAAEMHFTTPNEPRGLLRLLSSEIYTSMSITSLSIASAGMLAPNVFRLIVPLAGEKKLWPRPSNCRAGQPQVAEAFQHGEMLLKLIDADASMQNYSFSSAHWVWYPVAVHAEYLFDYIPGRHGRTASWRGRKVRGPSVTLCLAWLITLFVAGVLVLTAFAILIKIVRPKLMDTINEAALFTTASYRRLHCVDAILWVVSATFVQWPMRGVFLRWRTRGVPLGAAQAIARPWPGQDGEEAQVCTVKFAREQLPTFPELPDQRCFLFAVEAGGAQALSSPPWFPNKFDTEIYATGMLQFGQNQSSLKVGRSYQFRIIAYDAQGRFVEQSQWSRPVMVQPPQPFTEYPFLLWKACFGTIPKDSLRYFMTKYCLPIEASPTALITLSNLRLAVANCDGPFGGSWPGTYGDENLNLQYVSIAFESAEGSRLGADLSGSTSMKPLPSQAERRKKDQSGRTPSRCFVDIAQELMATRKVAFAPNTEFVMLNFDGDTLTLPVQYDRSTYITIEAYIHTQQGICENTAKVTMSWDSFLHHVVPQQDILPSSSSKRQRKSRPIGQMEALVLRDGPTPTALLTANISFRNTIFGESNPPYRDQSFPDVFHNVLPAVTFIWGETILLSWETREDTTGYRTSRDAHFDIKLVSESFSKSRATQRNNKAKSDYQISILAQNIPVNSGKALVSLAPQLPQMIQFMRCHLEAHNLENSCLAARSWQFAVSRPVTMHDLELGYATFCQHNRIPMQPSPMGLMKSCCNVEIAQRQLHVCKGYRPLLPTELKLEGISDPDRGPSVISDESSTIVVAGPAGLCVPAIPGEESRSPSTQPKMPNSSTQTNTQDTLSSPLLEAGSDHAITKAIQPRRELMNIPSNVFWNWNADWSPDLLLHYEFLPAIARPEYIDRKLSLLGAPSTVAVIHGLNQVLRFVLGCLFYYVQIAIAYAPALILLASEVFYDVVQSVSSPHLMPYHPHGRPGSMFLTDFMVSPSWARWESLDDLSRAVFIVSVFYCVVFTIAHLYCNFFHPVYYDKQKNFFRVVNSFVIMLWLSLVFLFLYVVAIICIWIVLGVLINPSMLMPYAIIILASVALSKTLWDKMKHMQDTVMGSMRDKLDHVLHAIMEVFIEDPLASSDIDEDVSKFVKHTSQIIELMAEEEQSTQERLLKQTSIVCPVPAELFTRMEILRGSTKFQTLAGQSMNKVLATDFVGDKVTKDQLIARAREIVVEEAKIDGTFNLGDGDANMDMVRQTKEYVQLAEEAVDITQASLIKASAETASTPFDDHNKLDKQQLAAIATLSANLQLRPDTAAKMYHAFKLALHGARQKESYLQSLEQALSCAQLFSKIRFEQLFSHFLQHKSDAQGGHHFDAEDDGPMPKDNSLTAQFKALEVLEGRVKDFKGRRKLSCAAATVAAAKKPNTRDAPDSPQEAIHFDLTSEGEASDEDPGPVRKGAVRTLWTQVMDDLDETLRDFKGRREAEKKNVTKNASSPNQTSKVCRNNYVADVPEDDFQISFPVHSMLHKVQLSQLDNLRVLLAQALTATLNWQSIKARAFNYAMETLLVVINRSIDRNLSPIIGGSTAFNFILRAGNLVFRDWDAVYEKDPCQLFVDCEIIPGWNKANPTTHATLTEAIDSQRSFDNSLTPDCLINAMKIVCLPACQPTDNDDVPAKTYLWYGALLGILDELGWATEDLHNSTWLINKWSEITDGTSLFGYQSLDEVTTMIYEIGGCGLWKAAMQSLMLTIKIGGYLGCDCGMAKNCLDKKVESQEKAHEVSEKIDPLDLRTVGKQVWPAYVEELWSQVARSPPVQSMSTGAAGKYVQGPLFLSIEQIDKFLESLVYLPTMPTSDMTFAPLSPLTTDADDLVWVLGSDQTIWHCLLAPSGTRQLRGLCLEMAMALFARAEFIPSDLDVYFEALQYQMDQQSAKTQWLRLTSLHDWLRNCYFRGSTWCTFPQFLTLMHQSLECDIPESVLKSAIFDPCPKDPDDDMGELRNLADLGAALNIWIGYGLWPSAVAQVVDHVVPRGPCRTLAHSLLQDEFRKLDLDGSGVLQPGETLVLVYRLVKPGLNLDDVGSFINDDLQLKITQAEVNKYFAMMDLNADGVLQAEEFVPFFKYLVFHFFPKHILESMNLSWGQLISFLSFVIFVLLLLFALVELVMKAFEQTGTAAASIHSAVNTFGAASAKLMSDSSIGFEDTMANLTTKLEALMLEAIFATFGLSKACCDRLMKLITNFDF